MFKYWFFGRSLGFIDVHAGTCSVWTVLFVLCHCLNTLGGCVCANENSYPPRNYFKLLRIKMEALQRHKRMFSANSKLANSPTRTLSPSTGIDTYTMLHNLCENTRHSVRMEETAHNCRHAMYRRWTRTNSDRQKHDMARVLRVFSAGHKVRAVQLQVVVLTVVSNCDCGEHVKFEWWKDNARSKHYVRSYRSGWTRTSQESECVRSIIFEADFTGLAGECFRCTSK